jgi:hypothetical protein
VYGTHRCGDTSRLSSQFTAAATHNTLQHIDILTKRTGIVTGYTNSNVNALSLFNLPNAEEIAADIHPSVH